MFLLYPIHKVYFSKSQEDFGQPRNVIMTEKSKEKTTQKDIKITQKTTQKGSQKSTHKKFTENFAVLFEI